MLLTVRWPRCGPVYWAVTWGSRQYVLTQVSVKNGKKPARTWATGRHLFLRILEEMRKEYRFVVLGQSALSNLPLLLESVHVVLGM